MSEKPKNSPLAVIFTTVLVDLIGFGMVIPLIGLYGRHFGADGIQLSILGGIFSLMQFFFTPFWGRLSDRVGRRPVLLLSLFCSTLSYVIFAFAPNYTWLLISRALGGIFAANISTAQAYIADITPAKDRAKGMGLIGAAFGIGFTLGPPLGGIASAKLGLAAPGLIAAAICGLNFLAALYRLPESLTKEVRSTFEKAPATVAGRIRDMLDTFKRPQLAIFMFTSFLATFSFTTMEQTFSLLFQNRFDLDTGEAGMRSGMVLMTAGLMGAVVQGGLIRKLVPRYGELRVLVAGILCNAIALGFFPYCPNYPLYFIMILPISLGFGLINPSVSALISRSASAQEQGKILGLSQSLGSLARATGPFLGLLTFEIRPDLPYWIAASLMMALFLFYVQFKPQQNLKHAAA